MYYTPFFGCTPIYVFVCLFPQPTYFFVCVAHTDVELCLRAAEESRLVKYWSHPPSFIHDWSNWQRYNQPVSAMSPIGSFSFWLPTSSQQGRAWCQQHNRAQGAASQRVLLRDTSTAPGLQRGMNLLLRPQDISLFTVSLWVLQVQKVLGMHTAYWYITNIIELQGFSVKQPTLKNTGDQSDTYLQHCCSDWG